MAKESVEWNSLSIPKLQQFHQYQLTHYNGCNYLSMLGFKLIDVSEGGPSDAESLSTFRNMPQDEE